MPPRLQDRLKNGLNLTRWAAVVGAALMTVVLAASVDVAKLQGFIARKFGQASLQNYAGWQTMMDNIRELSTEQKLRLHRHQ